MTIKTSNNRNSMPKNADQKFYKIRPGTEVRIVPLPGEENVRLPWEQVRIVTFQDKIYEIVRKIPKGQTLTYKQVAQLAGRPKACRAVGNILNKNYDPDIPCHRVIRSDKKMGGYNRGASAKQKLLKDEGFDFYRLRKNL